MLVLLRKEGQAIRIDHIVIRVLSVQRGKVRLGIEAPRSVSVLRDDAKRRTPKVVYDQGAHLAPIAPVAKVAGESITIDGETA